MTPKDDILAGLNAVTTSETSARAELERLMPPRGETSLVTIACAPADYSAGHIARAVEDCDAHLLNLNVTSGSTPGGLALVELRVSHCDPSGVARSLERYGYEVVATSSSSPLNDDDARSRAREFIHYLSV